MKQPFQFLIIYTRIFQGFSWKIHILYLSQYVQHKRKHSNLLTKEILQNKLLLNAWQQPREQLWQYSVLSKNKQAESSNIKSILVWCMAVLYLILTESVKL